jgi:hypothetical protein
VSDAGQLFVRAIADKNADDLKALLAPDLNFKALTPRKFWEAADADDLVDRVILGTWFTPSDVVERVEEVESDVLADLERVRYRFALRNPDGRFAVEQQAYYTVHGGRIDYLRVMCSGYRPVNDTV